MLLANYLIDILLEVIMVIRKPVKYLSFPEVVAFGKPLKDDVKIILQISDSVNSNMMVLL